ncbi:hypothetical protein HQ560_22090 [bacterium]|nr:hypothetical protein [bacterium]
MKQEFTTIVCVSALLAAVCSAGTKPHGPISSDPKLRKLEQILLANNRRAPFWPDAYRDLMRKGLPGWKLIMYHEFTLVPETDHLRGLSPDVGALPKKLVVGFDKLYFPKFKKRFSVEAWAIRYTKRLNHYTKGEVWEVYIPWLTSHLKSPRKARFTIGILRNGLDRMDDGYPWNGPPEEQRRAIKGWIDYLNALKKEHLNPSPPPPPLPIS